MPLLWIEYNGVKEQVRYSDAGICDLRFLSCEPHSLRLSGLAGYVDIVTCSFNVSDLRADTSALRGSNAANPIVITGIPGTVCPTIVSPCWTLAWDVLTLPMRPMPPHATL